MSIGGGLHEERRVFGVSYKTHNVLYFHLSITGGTHSSKFHWTDSKKRSSCAVESEANIEFGGKKKDEDAGGIKEGGHLEM